MLWTKGRHVATAAASRQRRVRANAPSVLSWMTASAKTRRAHTKEITNIIKNDNKLMCERECCMYLEDNQIQLLI